MSAGKQISKRDFFKVQAQETEDATTEPMK